MKNTLAIICLFLFAGIVTADPVADFINAYIQRTQVPGVAVMVRQNGKVVRMEGFGYANLEHKVPVKPETIFQSGSMGKQFTAMGVMFLADEGKLSVDDPISKYLEVPDTWKGITIRHLLTHTSGLGDYPESFDMRKDYTEDEVFKMVTAQPLQFAPGEKWSYSNLAYVTLGILIHKVSGKFYGDFLKERVWEPLGMKSTRIISEADIIPNRAAGYELQKGVLKNQDWVAPTVNTTADGSMYFNVEDLAKWDEGLEGRKLLSAAGYDQIWTAVKLNSGKTETYGFGWGVQKTRTGHVMIDHGGAWQGFATYIARYPEDHLSVAVLANRAGAGAEYIAHKVAGFYQADLGPVKHTATRVSPSILKTYEGSYRLEDRLTLKITLSGETLTTTFQGQNVLLIPESETSFFEEDSERTFRFVKGADGKVKQLIISVPEDLTFTRID